VSAVVASVLDQVPAGSLPSLPSRTVPILPPVIASPPSAPDRSAAETMRLTLVERTLVRPAMRLPGWVSDVALASVLPVLALEIALRMAGRASVARFRDSPPPRRLRARLWVPPIAGRSRAA